MLQAVVPHFLGAVLDPSLLRDSIPSPFLDPEPCRPEVSILHPVLRLSSIFGLWNCWGF